MEMGQDLLIKILHPEEIRVEEEEGKMGALMWVPGLEAAVYVLNVVQKYLISRVPHVIPKLALSVDQE